MAYKKLIKVSNVCQVLDKSKYLATRTENGITFTNNGDGSYTANGTFASSDMTYFYFIDNITLLANHKYLVLNGTYYEVGKYSVWLVVVPKLVAESNGILFGNDYVAKTYTPKKNEKNVTLSMHIKGNINTEIDNFVFKPQLFDLTEMYSAGHEPTTVEQFRQDFPEEMYDYSPHCWLTSYKRVIVTGNETYPTLTAYRRNLTCKTKNLFPYPYFETTRTKNGITFTNNGDGSITANGTATGNAPFYLFESSTSLMGLKAGSTYTISMEGSTASCYLVVNYYSDGSWHPGQFDSFHPEFRTKTIPSTWEGLQCYILVVLGATINNVVFKPMIELGSTATDYVPYGHL